ncbi:MAG: hypothetical protein JO057_04635, partial [Chloroflexi bacterium]|nr:hypothetical protein [Chloroflexota bacterium]
QFSSDLVVDIRTYVLSVALVPLVVLGLGVASAHLRNSSSARLTLYLLAVIFVAPLFSAEIGGHLSISSFRTFYLLIPLYLLASRATAWLIGHRAQAVQIGGCVLVLVVVAAQALGMISEIQRHDAFLEDLARRWQPHSELTLFRDNGVALSTHESELQTNGSYQYYFLQLAPLSAAVRILDRVPIGSSRPYVVIVRVIGPVQPGTVGGATRLVFYLRSLGASAALFDPSTQTLRGTGWLHGPAEPAYVVADGPDAAAAAARVLSEQDRNVQIVDFEWPV